MGVSTDGILVFGIPFEEDEVPQFLSDWADEQGEEYPDFDDYLDSLSGLPQYGETGHDFTKDREWREAQPVEMVTHCHHEYPMYILAVRGTKTTAWRGSPKVITTLDVSGHKIAAFAAWCAERGIKGEPKWLLCSMWG